MRNLCSKRSQEIQQIALHLQVEQGHVSEGVHMSAEIPFEYLLSGRCVIRLSWQMSALVAAQP